MRVQLQQNIESLNLLQKQKGCSFDCGLVDATKVVCVCPPGFGLEEDGKTCFQYYPGKI